MDLDDVVDTNGSLVRSIARRYWKMLRTEQQSRVSVADLEQICWLRLCEKLPDFDPSRGVPRAAFVVQHSEWAIRDALRKEDPTPRAHRDSLRESEKIKDWLRQALSREPTAMEVAQALGITEDELQQRERSLIRLVPLETLPEPQLPPEQETGACRRKIVEMAEACLVQKDPKRYLAVLLYHLDGRKLREIAPILDVSIPTAQRLVQEGERLLKRCFEERGWQLVDT